MPKDDASSTDPLWRQRALERSLRTATARAMSRSDRFIRAATELLDETGRTDFTVQEIAEWSKMSLRSFYQHFASKDELLLALLEEVIRNTMERLRVIVYEHADPVDRLRTYVQSLYGTVETEANAESRALTLYHLRLAESHPSEFALALAPQIELLDEILEQGVAAGAFRADVDTRQLAMLLTQSLVSALHMRVLGVHINGIQVSGDDLWEFFFRGIAASHPRPEPGRRLGRRQ